MIKFILPTQNAPKIKTEVGDLNISPNKRAKIEVVEGLFIHLDSMIVESVKDDWGTINEWLTFHNIIFDDHVSLDWYESQNFETNELVEIGECHSLGDYSDISNSVYFLNTYPEILNYKTLYEKFLKQTEENKTLAKNILTALMLLDLSHKIGRSGMILFGVF